MAAKDVKMATDNLSCPVCYQLFRKPKYLPCHHSYCEECLEKMQVRSKIICPECRKEATVPEGGVKDLDNNFFINRLVDEFVLKRKVEGEADVKCDECCGDDPVVAFCPDCTMFLCHVCNEHHKRSPKYFSHGIVPLTELRSKKDVKIQAKPKVMMCREHDEQLKYYCETCEQLVCLYCTLKDHNGHNHDTVKKMAGKQREELRKMTAPVEKMITGLSEAHDKIEKMKKKIRQQGVEVDKQIDEHYDGVIQKLLEQKEDLKQQVRVSVSLKEKEVTTQLEEVEFTQAEVLSLKELNDALEKSSDQEVLSVKKQLIGRMQQVSEKHKKLRTEPVQSATLEFAPWKEPLPQFGLLCSTAEPDPRKCEVVDFPAYSIMGVKTEFTITTKDDNGHHCTRGGSQVSVQLEGVAGTTQVRDNMDGSYVASFVPRKVGEVKLPVLVNGEHIKGSPFSVLVARDYRLLKKPSKSLNKIGGMRYPWGIAVSRNGMWAVTDFDKHCVYMFDKDDRLVTTFGRKGSGKGELHGPYGVAFDAQDHVYVSEYINNRIQKFTIDGKHLLEFGKVKLFYPRFLTVHNSKVYVTDRNNHVSVFQLNGQFFGFIAEGQRGSPRGVAISSDNMLLVADEGHHCIYTFTLDGEYVGKFGSHGSDSGQFSSPNDIAVDMYGFILVADTGNNRVQIFDKHLNYIHQFGGSGVIGRCFGIAVSSSGNIYVTDRSNNKIQIFSY